MGIIQIISLCHTSKKILQIRQSEEELWCQKDTEILNKRREDCGAQFRFFENLEALRFECVSQMVYHNARYKFLKGLQQIHF